MRAAWLAALAGAVLALAGSLGSTAAATPEPVKVRAAAHQGFGRLVFEWPAPIAVDSRRRGERLTLRFARPFAADLGPVLDALGDYLVGAEPGADAREVVLRLAPEVTTRLDIEDDRIVVVDLMPAAATDGPLALRTGVHDGFLRIVLDWSEPIEFAAEADGRRLRLRFERAARIDAAAIADRCRTLLAAANASQGDRRSELRLTLRAGVRAQVAKVEGRQVVIDLYEPARAPPATATPTIVPAEAPRPPQLTPPASVPPRPGPPMPPPAKPAPPGPTLADAAPGDPALPEPAAPPPEAEASPLALKIAAAEVEGGVALDFVWSGPTAAAFLLRAGYLWSVFAPLATPTEPPLLPSLASPAPSWLGPGERVDAAGGMALRFPLRRPLAARVERTEDRWRIVLGAGAKPPQAAQLEHLPAPRRLRIVTGEAARLVRVTDPEVGDRLDFWPLRTPGLGQPRAQRLVDLELLATAQGLAWRARADGLRVEAIDGAVELLAPEGLRLSAGSIASPAPPAHAAEPTAVPPPRPPAERPAEPTSEPGVADSAVASSAEPSPTERAESSGEVAAHPAPTTPEPTTPEPTRPPSTDRPASVASEQAAPAARHQAAAVAPVAAEVAAPLGLARFAPATRDSLADRRVFWQRRVLNAAAGDRPAALLDLARFFLAHALAAEALAVLGVVAEPADAPDSGQLERARQGLTGAAQLLMDRPDEAAAGLEAPALDGDPEVALWRAVLDGARADWPRAAQELERSERTLDGYPAPLQLRLGLPAVRIAIEAGNQDAATGLLGRLKALKLGPSERARVAFVDGLASARRGAIDDADRIWGALEQNQDDPTRIDAGYARVQMLLDAGRLTPAEALAKLLAARPHWRPHPREPAMLDGLARLYLRTGEPSQALRSWRELLSHFPDAPDRARIVKAMRDSLVATLLPADGAGIGALRAYALYREFPELVPDGALGDRLHRRLAAQLASLDLIEPAAGLVGPLIEHLKGPDKAETGAYLAELWLRAPDPAAALAALDHSEVEGDLPQPLTAQRRMLRARALAAQDQPAAALALLADGADLPQRRLRAEILWQTRDWPQLIGALEDLLPARADPGAPLTEADQDLVIRLALAYARQGQAQALRELRARFAEAMHGQAGEPAFLMATLTPGRPGQPEAALAAAAEHLDRVRTYLGASGATK
jgi:hypothetical protein